MDIPFVKRAKKPSPKFIQKAMEDMNISAEKTALAGDQIFTDTLGANLAGVSSILVEPINSQMFSYGLGITGKCPFRKNV